MEIIGVKPAPEVFPENYFLSDFILSLIMSCIHTIYVKLMFLLL